MRMVELTRQDGDGTAAVVLSVGPLEDAAADGYADRLHRLLEQRTGHGLTARTTPVDSVSGAPPTRPRTPRTCSASSWPPAVSAAPPASTSRRRPPARDHPDVTAPPRVRRPSASSDGTAA